MAQTSSKIVSIDEIPNDKNLAKILAYPNPTNEIVEDRISQIKKSGINSLNLHGGILVDKLSVLGKGVVGLVVAATTTDSRQVALKIRRTDSRRHDMSKEAAMLQAANAASVGPKYQGSTKDLLVMDLVEGNRLPIWLGQVRGQGERARLRTVIRSLFEQTVRLDAYGLDHGELSRAHKNILVSSTSEPWIVDFESASQMRRVNNFTSLAQYLFLGNSFGSKVRRILGPINNELLLDYLRMYKSGKTTDAFLAVKHLLKLE